ncbi:MAG: hypothetical protein IMZ64_03030 [Bacteroidetes bacterium]|nr:hypothetical protein [Bacteroidota bacterium]
MGIKVVTLYPQEKTAVRLTGSVHVLIEDYGIDLRDIWVIYERSATSLKDRSFFVTLPRRKGVNPDGTECTYPVFQFTDKELQKGVSTAIIEAIKEYVRANFDSIPEQKAVKKKKKYDNAIKRPESKPLWDKSKLSTDFAPKRSTNKDTPSVSRGFF